MKTLVRSLLLSAIVVAAGCAGHGASGSQVPALPHAGEGSNCCGSLDADLYGCTSPDCCAKTGRDCGHPDCICRTLTVHPEEDVR